jgi:hypothetical protein
MSEKVLSCKADVTRFYCELCLDECVWNGTATQGELGDDGKIKTLHYEHRCKCDKRLHPLDKIYPIVQLREEEAIIQLLN